MFSTPNHSYQTDVRHLNFVINQSEYSELKKMLTNFYLANVTQGVSQDNFMKENGFKLIHNNIHITDIDTLIKFIRRVIRKSIQSYEFSAYDNALIASLTRWQNLNPTDRPRSSVHYAEISGLQSVPNVRQYRSLVYCMDAIYQQSRINAPPPGSSPSPFRRVDSPPDSPVLPPPSPPFSRYK